MSKVQFERKLVRYEVDNHCILLRDDQDKDFAAQLPQPQLLVQVGSKAYHASLNEFYFKDKFVQGIHFDNSDEHRFFLEQSIFVGHRVKVSLDKSAALVEGRLPVGIEIIILTKAS